ncbi:copper homeostasis protein [Pectobacterium brasiliense]|uniref:envelope stress response activation lipoprotein NlpE n=1 Tax=Pectobacterium brasiliense TaxID=180957 RepID=UPI0001A430EB|nr:envelope stress response activation lipoprotein NlpE [Pectobacterium brasiliense]KGA25001.1 copper homeostasis protein [Pectobacterium brasiliense]KRF62942.1 copper homeostasis protein [Pectobacterium brasiliense]MBN3186154.1 envelope stress response activation lipoprotein NlpE [Pectobacterium brasiliense]QHG30481.1 envelope stress response activation lipoprotein NlpE [Pectobacterium brasiliense]
MKKLAIGVLLIAGISGLIGCHTRSQVQEEPLKPMAQSYRGVLPCADCGGIDTSLFLEKDGTFVLREQYQTTREDNNTFASYGQWRRTADKLVLTDSSGEKRYFRPVDNSLEMLDQQGLPINSSLPRQLTATEQALPDTPMSMKGMYRYLADAATFSDCATGKTFVVANNAVLERLYLSTTATAGEPVLVSFTAHFAVIPSMEEGQMVKAVVPNSSDNARMNARANCDTQID